MTPHSIEVIKTIAALRALEFDWRALERSLPRMLPFATFDWSVSWWEHLRANRWGVHDELFTHTIRNASGELLAVAPMMVTSRPRRGPIRIRELQFLGSDPNVTEIRGLLVDPASAGAAQRALAAHLVDRTGDWDTLAWSGVPSGDEFHGDLERTFTDVEWLTPTSDFVLPLRDTWDEFKSGLSRNIKESIRKCYNAPKRDGLDLQFEVISSGPRVGEALDDFFRLHSERADLGGTVEHNDVFADPRSRAFLIDVCQKFAARGLLRIFATTLDGKTIATRIGFALGDSLYLYYSGFDPAYRRYSVMTRTVAEAIRYAIGAGFATVNLSTGNDRSKTRWGPKERRFSNAYVVAPSWRSSVARHLVGAARSALHGTSVVRVVGRPFARRRK